MLATAIDHWAPEAPWTCQGHSSPGNTCSEMHKESHITWDSEHSMGLVVELPVESHPSMPVTRTTVVRRSLAAGIGPVDAGGNNRTRSREIQGVTSRKLCRKLGEASQTGKKCSTLGKLEKLGMQRTTSLLSGGQAARSAEDKNTKPTRRIAGNTEANLLGRGGSPRARTAARSTCLPTTLELAA